MNEPASEFIRERLVCIGRIRTPDGKLSLGLRPEAEARNAETTRAFDLSPRTRRFRPGAIYSVPCRAMAIQAVEATYVEMFPDTGLVAAWQARSQAEETAHRVAQQERKESRVDRLSEFLRPLRNEYLKLDPVGRAAFEVRVLRTLRS